MKNLEMIRGAKIGSVIGTIVFLFFGLMPGFYFGGYGTVILLSKLNGGLLEPTLFSRIAVAMGMLVGVFSMLTVSMVIGGVLGATFGYFVSIPEKLKTLVKD
jgi:hypothetical protein